MEKAGVQSAEDKVEERVKRKKKMKPEVEWVIVFVFMTVCAVTDIRKKEISIAVIALFGILSFLYMGLWKSKGWQEMVLSMLPGIFLLLLGLCSRQSIGYGDGLLVSVLGIMIGLEKCIVTVAVGWIVLSVCALLLLVCQRVKGKSRIPFVPFLIIGLGVVFIAQKRI